MNFLKSVGQGLKNVFKGADSLEVQLTSVLRQRVNQEGVKLNPILQTPFQSLSDESWKLLCTEAETIIQELLAEEIKVKENTKIESILTTIQKYSQKLHKHIILQTLIICAYQRKKTLITLESRDPLIAKLEECETGGRFERGFRAMCLFTRIHLLQPSLINDNESLREKINGIFSDTSKSFSYSNASNATTLELVEENTSRENEKKRTSFDVDFTSYLISGLNMDLNDSQVKEDMIVWSLIEDISVYRLDHQPNTYINGNTLLLPFIGEVDNGVAFSRAFLPTLKNPQNFDNKLFIYDKKFDSVLNERQVKQFQERKNKLQEDLSKLESQKEQVTPQDNNPQKISQQSVENIIAEKKKVIQSVEEILKKNEKISIKCITSFTESDLVISDFLHHVTKSMSPINQLTKNQNEEMKKRYDTSNKALDLLGFIGYSPEKSNNVSSSIDLLTKNLSSINYKSSTYENVEKNMLETLQLVINNAIELNDKDIDWFVLIQYLSTYINDVLLKVIKARFMFQSSKTRDEKIKLIRYISELDMCHLLPFENIFHDLYLAELYPKDTKTSDMSIIVKLFKWYEKAFEEPCDLHRLSENLLPAIILHGNESKKSFTDETEVYTNDLEMLNEQNDLRMKYLSDTLLIIKKYIDTEDNMKKLSQYVGFVQAQLYLRKEGKKSKDTVSKFTVEDVPKRSNSNTIKNPFSVHEWKTFYTTDSDETPKDHCELIKSFSSYIQSIVKKKILLHMIHSSEWYIPSLKRSSGSIVRYVPDEVILNDPLLFQYRVSTMEELYNRVLKRAPAGSCVVMSIVSNYYRIYWTKCIKRKSRLYGNAYRIYSIDMEVYRIEGRGEKNFYRLVRRKYEKNEYEDLTSFLVYVKRCLNFTPIEDEHLTMDEETIQSLTWLENLKEYLSYQDELEEESSIEKRKRKQKVFVGEITVKSLEQRLNNGVNEGIKPPLHPMYKNNSFLPVLLNYEQTADLMTSYYKQLSIDSQARNKNLYLCTLDQNALNSCVESFLLFIMIVDKPTNSSSKVISGKSLMSYTAHDAMFVESLNPDAIYTTVRLEKDRRFRFVAYRLRIYMDHIFIVRRNDPLTITFTDLNMFLAGTQMFMRPQSMTQLIPKILTDSERLTEMGLQGGTMAWARNREVIVLRDEKTLPGSRISATYISLVTVHIPGLFLNISHEDCIQLLSFYPPPYNWIVTLMSTETSTHHYIYISLPENGKNGVRRIARFHLRNADPRSRPPMFHILPDSYLSVYEMDSESIRRDKTQNALEHALNNYDFMLNRPKLFKRKIKGDDVPGFYSPPPYLAESDAQTCVNVSTFSPAYQIRLIKRKTDENELKDISPGSLPYMDRMGCDLIGKNFEFVSLIQTLTGVPEIRPMPDSDFVKEWKRYTDNYRQAVANVLKGFRD